MRVLVALVTVFALSAEVRAQFVFGGQTLVTAGGGIDPTACVSMPDGDALTISNMFGFDVILTVKNEAGEVIAGVGIPAGATLETVNFIEAGTSVTLCLRAAGMPPGGAVTIGKLTSLP